MQKTPVVPHKKGNVRAIQGGGIVNKMSSLHDFVAAAAALDVESGPTRLVLSVEIGECPECDGEGHITVYPAGMYEYPEAPCEDCHSTGHMVRAEDITNNYAALAEACEAALETMDLFNIHGSVVAQLRSALAKAQEAAP